MWWLTAGVQALRKLRLENCKFKATLALTHGEGGGRREGKKGGGQRGEGGREIERQRREAFRKRMGLCLSACGKMDDFSITPALYNELSTESYPPFPTPSPFKHEASSVQTAVRFSSPAPLSAATAHCGDTSPSYSRVTLRL